MTRKIFIDWRGQSLFERPVFQPPVQSGVRNTRLFGPISKAHGFALKCYHSIVSFISSLLRTCRPAAVVRVIALAIISSLKRVLVGWPFAHVMEESHKRASPMVAHNYASAAIILVSDITWVVAPLNHLCPRLILRRLMPTVHLVFPDRIIFSHDSILSTRLVRIARQLELLGYSHFNKLTGGVLSRTLNLMTL